jgi:DNA-binding transcriptional ArsR family regulator
VPGDAERQRRVPEHVPAVACLAELVGAAPTAVSQHLAKLRLAGLVRGRREGTFIHYSAADTHVRALLAEALFHADEAARDTAGPPPAG